MALWSLFVFFPSGMWKVLPGMEFAIISFISDGGEGSDEIWSF